MARNLPVDEGIVESELQNELLELGLDLATGIFVVVIVWR